MSRCKHDGGNIQQFTEICLDCGHNIYETDEEYIQSLKQEINDLQKKLNKDRLSKLEQKRDLLLEELNKKNNDDNNSGW